MYLARAVERLSSGQLVPMLAGFVLADLAWAMVVSSNGKKGDTALSV